MNITLPIELIEQLPKGLNVSAACAEALAARVACDHRTMRCRACGVDHERFELERVAARELFRTIMWALDDAVRKVQSAEHAARIVRETAARWGVPGAAEHPIARPTRRARANAEHEAAKEREREAA